MKHCPSCTCEPEPLVGLFPDFWTLYPARNGKKLYKARAEEYFDKLKPEEQVLCVEAARRYARHVRLTDALACDAFRFIRNQLWKDFVTDDAGVGGVPRPIQVPGAATPPAAPAPPPEGVPCPPELVSKLKGLIGGKGMP